SRPDRLRRVRRRARGDDGRRSVEPVQARPRRRTLRRCAVAGLSASRCASDPAVDGKMLRRSNDVRWRRGNVTQESKSMWIAHVPYQQASGRLRALYDRIKGPGDNVDNIMLAHSLRPHSMEGHMALYKYVLHHSGNATPKWFLEAL